MFDIIFSCFIIFLAYIDVGLVLYIVRVNTKQILEKKEINNKRELAIALFWPLTGLPCIIISIVKGLESWFKKK